MRLRRSVLWLWVAFSTVALCRRTYAAGKAQESESTDGASAFDWFSNIQDAVGEDTSGVPSVARILVLMAALQAADATAGHDVLKALVQEGAASTRNLAEKLGAALGEKYARYQPSDESHPRGEVHINLGALLELEPEQLDEHLSRAAQLLTGSPTKAPSSAASAHDGDPGDSSYTEQGPGRAGRQEEHQAEGGIGRQEQEQQLEEETTSAPQVPPGATVSSGPTSRRSLLQSPAPAAGKKASPAGGKKQSSTQVIRNNSVTVVGSDKPLFDGTLNGSLLAAALNKTRLGSKLNGSQLKAKLNGTLLGAKLGGSTASAQPGMLGAALRAALGVNWEGLQDRVQAAMRRTYDRYLTNKPRIRASNRLEQVFKVVVDKLTSGEGLGQGCTPYVFNGGGRVLPETIIFPSFSLSKTTGNCVLIPEFIGNVEYPGQWSLLNSRVACLGPATEYLQVPAFWRAAATSAESFTCPTCRNEFSLGPDVTLALVGDSRKTVTFRNRAEFLAACKTNKTFGFGSGGLDAAIEVFRKRLESKKEILTRHLGLSVSQQQSAGGTEDDLLGGLGSWVNSAWGQWYQGAQSTLDNQAVRKLLQEHLKRGAAQDQGDQGGSGMGGGGSDASQDSHQGEGDGTDSGGNDGWEATLAHLLSKARAGQS